MPVVQISTLLLNASSTAENGTLITYFVPGAVPLVAATIFVAVISLAIYWFRFSVRHGKKALKGKHR